MKLQNIDDVYKLSPVQQDFLSERWSAQAVYAIEGRLDYVRLRSAWEKALLRHPTLRTAFHSKNLEKPVQVVQQRVPLTLIEDDWQHRSANEQLDEFETFKNDDRDLGFDLQRAPLMRLSLIHFASDVHRLVWTYHPLILDRYSAEMVFDDVLRSYANEEISQPAASFREYISWLRQQDAAKASAFWSYELGACESPSTLNGVVTKASATRNEQQLQLPAAVHSFLKQHTLSMASLLAAAWALVLCRYNDEDDAVFGFESSGRPVSLEQAGSIAGPFNHVLPARIQLTRGERLLPWLKRIDAWLREAEQHRHVSLSEICKWTEPFESVVTVIPGTTPIRASELRIELLDHTSAVDHRLVVTAREGATPALSISYDPACFKDSFIARILGQLKVFMHVATRDPDPRVEDISLLTPQELAQFRFEENPRPVTDPVHELFEQQAAATPESIAVVFGAQRLSYFELNERANQLAHHLRSQGIAAETNVGVCMHRSIETVVSLLAILKAGGVYIPFDPQLPSERLSYILEETNVTVLLTQQDLLFELPPIIAAAEVVCLDLEWDTIAQQSVANPAWPVAPEQIAYIIYTSGSTGRPKGVCIPHAAAANHMTAIKSTFGLTARDRMLQFASLSFDVSIEQILAPLLAGATVVLRPGDVWNPAEFWDQVVEQELTVLNLPPAYWNQIAQDLDHDIVGKAAETLRLMIVGGDAMPPEAVQRWQQSALGRVRLLNAYGPTETTITASVYDLPPQFSPVQRVPIGTRVGRRRLFVLDRQQRPVVTGGLGELYIGGVELAREYFRDPALTAARFLPDSFSSEPGSRMYRTGDVVRRLASGELSYEGRRDNQVKVRGYRIELGDIESALAAETEVQECVVALKEREGEKRLVAYVVMRPNSQLQSWELRARLKEHLPEHMLPASIVVLDSLPLTTSGKVDRRALPDADEDRPEQEATFAEPRNETEATLAALWTELLGIRRIGIADNFFEAGGDSLLATQLLARVNKQFQAALPLRALFDQPTVADLALNIDVYRATEHEQQIESTLRSNQAPLSYAQERLWFMHQLQPHSPLFNIAAAVRLRGELNLAALEQTFQEITRRHESLRTVFEVVDDAPVQVIRQPQPFSIPVSDVSASIGVERETEVQRLINEEAQRPFDLMQLPLLRVSLLRLSHDERVLVLVMHHIVSDGWSIGVLVREIAQLYEAFTNGDPSPLPELPLQYADFATWQKRSLEEEEGLSAQFDYWRQQLAGELPGSPLAPDRQRPETPSYRGATRTFEISSQLTEQLLRLGRQEGVTLFMTLMAAFQTLLHKHSGQEDIIVGTDLANRNRMEVEDLIGFFVNLLAIRTRPAAGLSFTEYLQQVRQLMLDAYANQDLPFDRLVTELQPDRRLNRTPVFQNLFVMQNTPMPPAKLSGLELTRMELDEAVAKFDLAVFMEEKDGRLIGRWNYSTELFDATTIERLATRFTRLLESIVREPATKLGALEMHNEAEVAQEALELRQQQDLKRSLLRNASRQRISRVESVVKTSYLPGCEALPLVIEPALEDVELAEWASHNLAFIETELLKHGALLFRNFRITSVSEFERCASTICPELFSEYGDLPREQMGRSVYGSTPYPSNQTILFHNESSHLDRWPMKIWFFCVKAARAGGETPIVDCRRVYSLLPPAIKERLTEKGIKYVRNYTEGLDVSWSDFFHTKQREQLEQQCRERGIEWQWHNNDLRTSKVRSAITRHPQTGETVFFNQLQLHHASCLESSVRESLLSTFGEERLPRNVYYGDGNRIEDEVMTEIGVVYEQAKVSFLWQEGDIMMLDNMLVAHGRNPFEGERKIVVALGEMCHEKAQRAQASATH